MLGNLCNQDIRKKPSKKYTRGIKWLVWKQSVQNVKKEDWNINIPNITKSSSLYQNCMILLVDTVKFPLSKTSSFRPRRGQKKTSWTNEKQKQWVNEREFSKNSRQSLGLRPNSTCQPYHYHSALYCMLQCTREDPEELGGPTELIRRGQDAIGCHCHFQEYCAACPV